MNNPEKATVDLFGSQDNSTDAISNIDPRNVENEIDRENSKFACLDVFEVGAHWRKASFKFDGLWKGLNHLTDFSLNQFGLGNFILKKEKGAITREMKMY